MKKVLCVIFLFIPVLLSSQDIELTFYGVGASEIVEEVSAKNLQTGESINMPGGEILHLRNSTGIEGELSVIPGLYICPNPFDYSARLLINHSENWQGELMISSLKGEIVLQQNIQLPPGCHEFEITFGKAGIYLISALSEKTIGSVKTFCAKGTARGFMIIQKSYAPIHQDKALKSQFNDYSLAYSPGDKLAFKCTTGEFTTSLTDAPEFSKKYEVEFADCIDPDGRRYDIVQIGQQIWMGENLAYLPNFRGCYVYDYNGIDKNQAKQTEYYQKYGVLYMWNETDAYCPYGWKIPSDEDWKVLEMELGMNQADVDRANWRYSGSVGEQLKSESGWVDDGNGSNAYQFNAKPGGYLTWKWQDGWTIAGIAGSSASFWAANGMQRFLFCNSGGIRREAKEIIASSIRCIKKPPVEIYTTEEVGFSRGLSIEVYGVLIHNDFYRTIEQAGFCWDTTNRPTIDSEYSIVENVPGNISSVLNGLDPNTKYFVRAYATLNNGITYYGNEISFKTYNEVFFDPRDSNNYLVMNYNGIDWMVENLAYLPQVYDPAICSASQPRYYVYDYFGNDIEEAVQTDNYKKYGVLYNNSAATIACPEGWKLPSDKDWMHLELTAGMNLSLLDNWWGRTLDNIGARLKSKKGWANGGNGNDSTKFNVLPAGYSYGSSNFRGLESSSRFWTGSRYNSNNNWAREFSSYSHGISRFNSVFAIAYSVRCIKYSDLPVILPSEIYKANGNLCIKGEILNEGGSEITSAGLILRDSENPGIGDSVIIAAVEDLFISIEFENIPADKNYFASFFATNQYGTAYSSQISFNSGFKDKRDNRIYDYLELGDQTWMAENLAYLPEINSPDDKDDSLPKYYVYDYFGEDITEAKKMDNYHDFGVLYNWEAASRSCPDGWHLPSDEEWSTLVNYLDYNGYGYYEEYWSMAKAMASKSEWRQSYRKESIGFNQESNNESGFNAFPGGFFNGEVFSGKGTWATFYSSTESDSLNIWIRHLYYLDMFLSRSYLNKTFGLSVRCIKNE